MSETSELRSARDQWTTELQLPSHLSRIGVQAWSIGLDLSTSLLVDLHGLLSPDERRRADRFLLESVRRRFIASHGTLRLLLSDRLGLDPRQISFIASPTGKPSIGGVDHPLAQFNLTHSGDRALVAMVADREIGIDLELIQSHLEVSDIAARFFAPTERQLIQKAAPSDQIALFYQIWTRKEAALKACGLGIASGLRDPDVSAGLVRPRNDHPLAVKLKDQVWEVTDLDLGQDYHGALAIKADA